jgi:hypothetical protein
MRNGEISNRKTEKARRQKEAAERNENYQKLTAAEKQKRNPKKKIEV